MAMGGSVNSVGDAIGCQLSRDDTRTCDCIHGFGECILPHFGHGLNGGSATPL